MLITTAQEVSPVQIPADEKVKAERFFRCIGPIKVNLVSDLWPQTSYESPRLSSEIFPKTNPLKALC